MRFLIVVSLLCVPSELFAQQSNYPFALSQIGPDNRPLPFNSRIAVPTGQEEVKLQAMLGAPVPCSEATFEYEIVEDKAQFQNVPNYFSSPQKICFGGTSNQCAGSYVGSAAIPTKPDRVYSWQVRVTSKVFQANATNCGGQTSTATSNWTPTSSDFGFGTAPNWYMTQAQLSETFNICGLEAYDQDSSYFSYPPDGKLAGFKTTSKPNCANTIQSTWSAYIPNKGRAKDGYLFVWVKSDRQCSGRFWISNDEVPQEEATIQTFTLQPDVFQKIGVKIGHSPDPAKDLDFMTYVHRSNYKDFVPLNFKCESDADFHVFFDTVAILYRGQNYSEAKHVDENDFFISLRSP